MSKFPIYERVAIRRDLDQYGLSAGDIATLVDYVPHPTCGQEGCMLEVFNPLNTGADQRMTSGRNIIFVQKLGDASCR